MIHKPSRLIKQLLTIVPTLRRGNAAVDAPASRNAGALLDEFPRRSVGTMPDGEYFLRVTLAAIYFLLLAVAPPAYTEEAVNHAGADHLAAPKGTDPKNIMNIDVERLQSIGVTFEEAKYRPMEQKIRTVGRVEIDERLIAQVNIKIEGWIEQLYVNTTGEHVKKGQILFTLYSPELVATQQEYLLALQSAKALGNSEFPEVARGANSLLDVARRRLRLWDIENYHLRDLERTGEVLKTLPIHAPLTGTVITKTA